MTSSQKKQQSISNFFARKSSQPAQVSPRFQSAQIQSQTNGHSKSNGSSGDPEDEGINAIVSLKSSNFAKRQRDAVIEADRGVESQAPPLKRHRTLPYDDDNADENHPHGNFAYDPPPRKQEPLRSIPVKRAQVTDRASKYLFTTSPTTKGSADEDDGESLQRKSRLHDQFVKKLGRPESLAYLRRKDQFAEGNAASEDTQGNDEDVDEEEDTQPRPPARSGRAVSKKGSKLTPMERQVLDIKKKHPEALLVVEVGYKYRFFGEDARIAAKELSIVCIPGKFRFDEHPSEAHLDRFASASIPTHRLHVHVKRLVSAGHKVGVVRQLETAALKAAGDNRNAPFVRQLTNLYTKGTYVDDIEGLESPNEASSEGAPPTGHLLCITETKAKGWGTDEKAHIGIVAVQPATGDIVYDDFEDGFMRSEIETRLLHIAPCEFLIVGDLSKATDKIVQHLSGSKTNVFGEKARLERVEKPKTAAANSYSHISKFYDERVKSSDNADSSQVGKILDKSHKLSEHVAICLSAMITHLTEYGLQHVFDLTKNFQPFSARSHMLLNGNTLTSLEIYRNQTDNTERGSLFWVLDQTQTRFGQRLLRKWVGRPLLDKSKLEKRIDAVEELKLGERTTSVDKLRTLLSKTKSDLEKSLIRIYYKKCTRPELLGVLQTLQRIATEYAYVKSPTDAGFSSEMLAVAIASLPKILSDVLSYLDRVNPQAAKDDDKYAFFREDHETDLISEHKLGISGVEAELDAHRATAAEKLKKKRVDYVTVAGIEFLIEVDNTQIKHVPASWAKISGTKKVARFHTPEVVRLIRERDQHRESLAAACDRAFTDLLSEISSKYQTFRDCIQSLATLDCLVSLAEVASRPDYCKPCFTSETRIDVRGARHPMVEQLLLDAYVPNDIALSTTPPATRALLITGPNMGGKSSYVRSVALVAIMAQVGSYVPAAAAELGILDAVFTRMGAADNMLAGESTFMVELSETSDILKQAGPRSLVILDELGRGTSTHDGVAIAAAVLQWLLSHTRCLLLFITHYQGLSAVAAASSQQAEKGVRNVHMRFTESGGGGGDSAIETRDDATPTRERKAADSDSDSHPHHPQPPQITFLYELGAGVAHRSYGLNVARLAGVPEAVIDVAGVKSRELEAEMRRARVRGLGRGLGRLLLGAGGGVKVSERGGEGEEEEKEEEEEGLEGLVRGIEEL